MSATATTARRRMGFLTLLSSIILLITLLWTTYNFVFIQFGLMRSEIPHEDYSAVEPWPYDINWAGGRSSWFENINYTDMPMNLPPPPDVLQQLENVIFYAAPSDPPQLWRSTSYDRYDGSSWTKSLGDTRRPATTEVITQSQAQDQGNQIYNIYLNVTAGPNVGSIDLPVLFPTIQVIADSFETGRIVSGSYQPDSPSRLLDYTLRTDDYGTLLFEPLLEGESGTSVLVRYEVTFENQDLAYVAANAREGVLAPAEIAAVYSTLEGVVLTQRVLDSIAPFDIAGMNAYETALAVSLHFQTSYSLMMDQGEYLERPALGQEVTDWFIRRGGGLPMDFATAYCVFMRHLDIPARIVMGYAVGDDSGSYRTLRVRHMVFWAEVFIPMNNSPTGGEWMQVIPMPLPGNMGGGEIPENTSQGSVQLYVGPPQWAMIGVDFNLSALLLYEGIPVTTPEVVYFRDETASLYMGNSTIEMGSSLPLANITYAFPDGSVTGLHIISATWIGPGFAVSNYTSVYAVAVPTPSTSPEKVVLSDFLPSETIDLDMKLGLDNYTTHWQDTLHVHGVMTVGGSPVNGTRLNNDQMQIMWDEGWIGNATIGADGRYNLNITVDPLDLVRMTTGNHKIWCQYAGEWDSGFPVLLPARSADNSTVTVWGTVGFTLTVYPTIAYRGWTLTYDGVAQLLNGTLIVGETIGVFLNGTLVNTAATNSTGGFRSTYSIPNDFPPGVVYAQVNWTSGMALVSGNWSQAVPITIRTGQTSLSINSLPKAPDVVHMLQDIVISGYLIDTANTTGIADQTIDVWWYNGISAVLIGSSITESDGYYEFVYTVPVGFEGMVTYWTEFESLSPSYASSRSVNMTIMVQRWIVEVSIQVVPNPVHLLESLTISGTVSLPELGLNLTDAPVTVWWDNSTGPHNLSVVMTSPTTFLYEYSMTIPFGHELGSVPVWTEFVSTNPALASNVSVQLIVQVINYNTTLTIFSNGTSYYLNETVHIWGRLQFENGSPWSGRLVYLYWTNGTLPVPTFPVTTNITGWYSFYYDCSVLSDDTGIVDVQVAFTSPTRLYDNATAGLTPSLTLQIYQVILLAATDAPEYHLNDVMVFSGILYFEDGTIPLTGANVTVAYRNSTSTYFYPKTTDSGGSFAFRYNYSMRDALGAVYVWASYTSSNPLWSDAESANRTATLILYQFVLTTATNSTSYHLNETVWVWGRLTYQDNGTPLIGQQVSVHWDWNNGTIDVFNGYFTNASGYFDFYYVCSVDKDRVANVTIWAEFINSVPLWSNATSAPGIEIDLVLYTTKFTMYYPSSVYLDQSIRMQGVLAYTGGSPVIVGGSVMIYRQVGLTWSLIGSIVTNSTGGFSYVYWLTVPPDNAGTYWFKCNYTTVDPLTGDASTVFSISVQRYPVDLVVTVSPNPAYLNETVVIYVVLSFGHNSTPVNNAQVSIWWFNGSDISIATVTTNSTGGAEYAYSGMSGDSIWTGIEVYGTYSGSLLIASTESVHQMLTLQQWITVIIGFNSGGVINCSIGQIITLTGVLYYELTGPDVPLIGAWIEILIDGSPVGSAQTTSDGSFLYNWTVLQSTTIGDHDIVAFYASGVTWIADSATAPITINVSGLSLVWSSFDVTPSVLYIEGIITVTGTLTLDNGSPYAGAPVFLWARHSLNMATFLVYPYPILTDDTGWFGLGVELTAPVGVLEFWANCTPSDLSISPGQSMTRTVDVRLIPVSLSAIGDVSIVYLGDDITISGNLTFGNGTGMVGYDVTIIWDGRILYNLTITNPTGSFQFVYTVPWTQRLGTVPYYVAFLTRPDRFENPVSAQQQVAVFDRVTLHLDPQAVVIVTRGSYLTVSGYVTHGGGNAPGVPLAIIVDPTGTWDTVSTGLNGRFSVSLEVPSSWSLGQHILTLGIDYGNYVVEGTPSSWTIEVHLGTRVLVQVTPQGDIMPGETFTVFIRLEDTEGGVIVGSVVLSLGSINIDTLLVNSPDGNTFEREIPLDWSLGSGLFTLSVSYAGYGYVDGSTRNVTDSIHVFTNVVFNPGTPTRINPGDSLTIICVLTDDSATHYPIVGRDVIIHLNGTSTETRITDDNGRITYIALESAPEGFYEYYFTLVSFETSSIESSRFTVAIQMATGPSLSLILIMVWAGAIVAEAIIGIIVIRRYRPHNGSTSRWSRFHLRIRTSYSHVTNRW